MHVFMIGSVVLGMGVVLIACTPLLDRFEAWLYGPVENEEFTIQGKMFDRETSSTQYFDIELTSQDGPKSATG